MLLDAEVPEWAGELETGDLDARLGESKRWRAEETSGPLPAPEQVLSIGGSEIDRLVGDGAGGTLAGYLDDGGYYPMLEDLAAAAPTGERGPKPTASPSPKAVITVAPAPVTIAREESDDDEYDEEYDEEFGDEEYDPWPLVIVAEPDLLNNSGLADAERARLALDLFAATLDEYDQPIVFDLTLAGLGQSENLLTLAFEPPFLAATLMLLLAALVIGWRGFVRFGPPLAESGALAGGKAQLARDGSTLLARARRMRLVGPPYARLVAARVGRALGLSERAGDESRAASIARALERRGEHPESFAQASQTLERARKPADLLRAARALKSIERKLAR
jgi:hypothetical protein